MTQQTKQDPPVNEKQGILIQTHIKISDPSTGKVLLNTRG